MAKMAILAQKGQKRAFWPKNPKNGVLGLFSAPGGLPGQPRRGCFYINPSRRGPVPGRGGVASAVQARGPARIGRVRGSPPRESVARAPLPGDRLSRSQYCKEVLSYPREEP